jgi:uncharacterized membrane protein YgcG
MTMTRMVTTDTNFAAFCRVLQHHATPRSNAYISADVRFGLFSLLYLVVGVLVAAGIIGSEGSYFSGLSNLEELVEMVLAVLLWPLVLLDVNVNSGDINIGGGDSGGGDSGGGGSAGAAGGEGGGK